MDLPAILALNLGVLDGQIAVKLLAIEEQGYLLILGHRPLDTEDIPVLQWREARREALPTRVNQRLRYLLCW